MRDSSKHEENPLPVLIRVGEQEKQEYILAETLGDRKARLLEIPARHNWLSIFDILEYDAEDATHSLQGTSFPMRSHVFRSGYRAYDAWALVHRPQEFAWWLAEMEQAGLVVQEGEWVHRTIRQLKLAIPPEVSALSALVLGNRLLRTVELIVPLLAADADDLDRAKNDLDRAVGWGAQDVELTRGLAEAFEGHGHIEDSVLFWERLTHLLPDDVEVRAHLASNYACLGVFPHAAQEYDRAATLARSPEMRLRLEEARDSMWERSKE